MNWFRAKTAQLFTESDGVTLCPVRVFGFPFAVLASITFIGLAVWTVVVLRQPLNYSDFGVGVSSIWATYAGSIVGREKWGDSK